MLFQGCAMGNSNGFLFYQPLSKGEKLVNKTLNDSAIFLKNKFNIRPCGEGASMPGGPIRNLSLCFTVTGPLPKEQLKKILIDCAQHLMQQVNENKDIQPFLEHAPFTIKDIQIILYVYDKDRRDLYDPLITTAQISDSIFSFRTNEKGRLSFKNCYDEPYQEETSTDNSVQNLKVDEAQHGQKTEPK